MRFIYPFILLSVLLSSCKTDYEKLIESTLHMAGNNRSELEYVLDFYKRIKPDKEKLKAAKFLIGNMRFHQSMVSDRVIEHPHLDSLITEADSLLYAHVLNTHADSLYTSSASDSLNILKQEFKEKKAFFNESDSTEHHNILNVFDSQWISSDFLIEHIDLMFKIREDKPELQENETYFYEYVLPYKSIPSYFLMNRSTDYYALFNKYLEDIPIDSTALIVRRYNFVVNELRSLLPEYPFKKPIGVKELFFNGFHDCVPIADFGSQILRTKGVPIAIEYNVAYKQFVGSHSHCVVPGKKDEWLTFSPESSLPRKDSAFYTTTGALNIYRFMYSEQRGSPFFLRKKDEHIPPNLSSPFIKDASKYTMPTIAINLSFNQKTKNGLAYLATYNRGNPEGMIPVTWGEIKGRKVRFKNVIPERFYSPIYFDEHGNTQSFGNSFYIDESGKITYLDDVSSGKEELTDITIISKFPRKPEEIRRTNNLIGSVILGSNDPGFSESDTIATIHSLLRPSFQDIKLDLSRGPYQYYRFSTPPEYPNAYIGEIQFLTSADYNYTNVMEVSPLPELSVGGTGINRSHNLVRVLDGPLQEWQTEYDGNPQTGPHSYPAINFLLDEPKFITTVRLMPINADNGIIIGDTYELYYLENGVWVFHEGITAKYNFIQTSILKNRIYWLKNITKGKEELPFVINDNNEQAFLYYDIPES